MILFKTSVGTLLKKGKNYLLRSRGKFISTSTDLRYLILRLVFQNKRAATGMFESANLWSRLKYTLEEYNEIIKINLIEIYFKFKEIYINRKLLLMNHLKIKSCNCNSIFNPYVSSSVRKCIPMSKWNRLCSLQKQMIAQSDDLFVKSVWMWFHYLRVFGSISLAKQTHDKTKYKTL